METGIIISTILAIIIVLDLVIKTKAKTYSLIQFLSLLIATVILIFYLIIANFPIFSPIPGAVI